ncbi:MAG TPA: glycosyltransferase, partial [Deinococcales bacterium]|nr:glycosyltransferase [Deinococcales bacterium]
MTENGEAGGSPGSGLDIALLSIHGLIRGSDLELGRDADTGGQTKYVVELAEALCACPGIRSVRLFTRLIEDSDVSADYAELREPLPGGAEIIRIKAGPDGYIRKEQLYPHLADFTANFLAWCEENDWRPDVVHGHYADAARAGMDAAEKLGVPFVFTGHSLGRNKRKVLLEAGEEAAEIDERFRFDERIGIEEEALRKARLVVASTQYEIETGYELYDAGSTAAYTVRAPGIDLDRFHPYYHEEEPSFHRTEEQMQAARRMREEIGRFLTAPDKPMVLAISRPDRRKNIGALVEAYGRDPELRELANLVIFAGVRKDIEQLDDNEREV